MRGRGRKEGGGKVLVVKIVVRTAYVGEIVGGCWGDSWSK